MSQNRHVRSLMHALKILQSEKYYKYLNAIYLYGSCARGEQKYDSDIDLFLFLDKDTPAETIRQMRLDVIPENYKLPNVEIKYSMTDSFSTSKQFDMQLRKDAKLLWMRK